MVNNAGGGIGDEERPRTLPYEEWVQLIDFNLTGTFLCCIAAGKQMIDQKGGKIINISSIAGTKGNPGMLHYSAAKAGCDQPDQQSRLHVGPSTTSTSTASLRD